MSGGFVNTHIEEGGIDPKNFLDVEEEEEEAVKTGKLKDSLGGRDIVQLKINHIPSILIPLESLFDQNYVAKVPKVEPATDAFEDINISTKEDPKIIKLSKKLPTE